MYDITLNNLTTDGEKIETVMLRNQPEDAEKIIRIKEGMEKNGWVGRPVIMAHAGDHYLAYTGSHRLAAVAGLDTAIDSVFLPDDLTTDDYDLIDEARDDEELLAAFIQIAEKRDDMDKIISAMEEEIEKNTY